MSSKRTIRGAVALAAVLIAGLGATAPAVASATPSAPPTHSATEPFALTKVPHTGTFTTSIKPTAACTASVKKQLPHASQTVIAKTVTELCDLSVTTTITSRPATAAETARAQAVRPNDSVSYLVFNTTTQEICSGLGCPAWHAEQDEGFYTADDNGYPIAFENLWGYNNAYNNCYNNYGGIGYSVSITTCGWSGSNPAWYYTQNAEDLVAYETILVSVVASGTPVSQSHWEEFHDYGDGYVGYHAG